MPGPYASTPRSGGPCGVSAPGPCVLSAAMERIFISSLARGDMAAIRGAARAAVESLDMRPVMFETQPASAEGSRRALLDEVGKCDALLLLVGAEYGESGERGISPTEEEFQQARGLGIDVLVLVQDGIDREPAQQDFLARVRGTWEQGNFTANFTGPGDVALATVKTLNAWQRGRVGTDQTPAAVERALELARGDERRGMLHGGSKLRVVATPLLNGPLIGAVELADRNRLFDPLAGAARTSGLVPQSMGIESSVEADRLQLTAQGPGETLNLIVGFDGSVVGEGEVGGDAMGLGGMMVRADRARSVITRTAEFAQRVWEAIDTRDEIRNILLAAAVPEAEHKSWVEHDPGNSMSMPMSMPHVLIAPEQPLRARRADLGQPETVDRLHAELRLAFELAGAVQQRNSRGS
jgi:hypothetical protein